MAASGRQRGKSGLGTGQGVALAAAALVILGLTFVLGMLVGRQWARQSAPVASVEPGRKTAAAPRRSGLTEPSAARAPQLQEKLTFYQTLTAPLGASPPPGKSDASVKGGAAAAKPREHREERVLPKAVTADSPERATLTAVDTKVTEERREAPAQWTIQVGVFKTPEQAAGVRKHLAAGGFEAQVAETAAEDAQTRYRVRVGSFRTRDEALRAAERIRATRALPTFVTAR